MKLADKFNIPKILGELGLVSTLEKLTFYDVCILINEPSLQPSKKTLILNAENKRTATLVAETHQSLLQVSIRPIWIVQKQEKHFVVQNKDNDMTMTINQKLIGCSIKRNTQRWQKQCIQELKLLFEQI